MSEKRRSRRFHSNGFTFWKDSDGDIIAVKQGKFMVRAGDAFLIKDNYDKLASGMDLEVEFIRPPTTKSVELVVDYSDGDKTRTIMVSLDILRRIAKKVRKPRKANKYYERLSV